MTPSLAGLRHATRDVHERLHTHPAFAPLTVEPPDLAGYARLLIGLRGFHVPAETWLFAAAERCVPGLDDLAERRKAHLLGEDLQALAAVLPDIVADQGARTELERDPRLPAVLGGLYVVEGATLGGRELGRRLAGSLLAVGMAEPAGCRFLLAYEPRQGAMWRKFCAVLDQASASFTTPEFRVMEDAARDMFLKLESWLTRTV